MLQYQVEVLTGSSVVWSTLVQAMLPFEAATLNVLSPVTIRRTEQDWIRVNETNGKQRTFSYVVRR